MRLFTEVIPDRKPSLEFWPGAVMERQALSLQISQCVYHWANFEATFIECLLRDQGIKLADIVSKLEKPNGALAKVIDFSSSRLDQGQMQYVQAIRNAAREPRALRGKLVHWMPGICADLPFDLIYTDPLATWRSLVWKEDWSRNLINPDYTNDEIRRLAERARDEEEEGIFVCGMSDLAPLSEGVAQLFLALNHFRDTFAPRWRDEAEEKLRSMAILSHHL